MLHNSVRWSQLYFIRRSVTSSSCVTWWTLREQFLQFTAAKLEIIRRRLNDCRVIWLKKKMYLFDPRSKIRVEVLNVQVFCWLVSVNYRCKIIERFDKKWIKYATNGASHYCLWVADFCLSLYILYMQI